MGKKLTKEDLFPHATSYLKEHQLQYIKDCIDTKQMGMLISAFYWRGSRKGFAFWNHIRIDNPKTQLKPEQLRELRTIYKVFTR